MRKYYALFVCLIPVAITAQPQLPAFLSTDTVTVPCPQDPGTMIHTYTGWEAYQTLDDTWWGPRDPSICIDLAQVVGQWVYPRIAVDQIDATRPVFLRARYDDLTVLPLATNNQYAIGFQAYGPGSFDAGTCPGGPCTGLFAAVRIPDAAGTGTDLRWYDAAIDNASFSQYQLQLCVPTEKFQQNDLREFIVSMKLANPQAGQYIESFYSEIQDMDLSGTLVRLTPAQLPVHQSGQFNYSFGFDWLNYLVLHPDTIYPDAQHIGYLDITPVPNVATPTPVTVTLQEYCGFNFQPFAQLRGGLVLGSDSVRHPLTVINNGADLCMGWEYIEVVWGGNDRYVHAAGQVNFEGEHSCFQFLPGSTLEVPAGSTFHYGHEGRGILAMINGANLEIGNGGTLVMHGMLVIKEPPAATDPVDMRVTLGPDARLVFAPGSRLHNDFSIGSRMKLIVTLDGGSIDIDGLSPEDRMKVVVISIPPEPLTEIRLLGNPATSLLKLEFASRTDGVMSVRAIDSMGRLAVERSVHVSQGDNRALVSIASLRAGTYVLETRFGDDRRMLRFVKE